MRTPPVVCALVLVGSSLSSGCSAPAEARPPESTPRADQYMRSCMPYRHYGFSATKTGTNTEMLADDNGANVLFPWGSQVEVTCEGAADHRALVCFHQSPAGIAGIDFGASAACGDGCGEYNDSAGPTGVTRHMPCLRIQNGASKYRMLQRGVFMWDRPSAELTPTSRSGRCTTVGSGYVLGAPCNSNAECGSGGACTKDGDGPRGAFMDIGVSSTSLKCSVEICI